MWGKKRKFKKAWMTLAGSWLFRKFSRSWREVDERRAKLKARRVSDKGIKSLETLAIELAYITPKSPADWHKYLCSCVAQAMDRAKLGV